MLKRSASRLPLLASTLATHSEALLSSNVINSIRQGELALQNGLQQQQRLYSAVAAAHSGVLGLSSPLLTLNSGLGLGALRQFSASSQQVKPAQPEQQKEQAYDSLELTEEKIGAITDKIPQRPVGVVEGTSYTLIIIAAFGVLAFVLYHVLTSLIFEPTALSCFNAALERLKGDPRITVRIGSADDIRAWGTNSESRVARQQIPHQIYKDQNGVEHVRIQFYIRGPSGTGMVNADMYKDGSGQWAYTYLVVDSQSSSAGGSPQRLVLVAPR